MKTCGSEGIAPRKRRHRYVELHAPSALLTAVKPQFVEDSRARIPERVWTLWIRQIFLDPTGNRNTSSRLLSP